MLIDTRILHRAAGIDVLAQRREVMFRDGSTLQLHIVHSHGVEARLQRALQVDGAWCLLPLCRALPSLADDIRHHPSRDVHGLIWYTLRSRWGTVGGCLDALRPHLRPLQGGAAVALPEPGEDALAAAAQPVAAA